MGLLGRHPPAKAILPKDASNFILPLQPRHARPVYDEHGYGAFSGMSCGSVQQIHHYSTASIFFRSPSL